MIAGIILGTFFIVSASLSKKGKDKSIVFLTLIVLFLTLNNLQICLVDNNYISVNYFVRRLLIPWYMLILPSFYSFLMYYLKVEKKIFSFIRISIYLFLLEIIIRIGLAPNFYSENNSYIVAKYSQIEEIINAAYTIFLFIKAFILLFSYSKLYQYVLSFDNVKWLKNFMFLGSIVLLMWVCAILLNLDKVINPEIYIYYPMRLSCSIILYWIGYQGFFNYSLMTERIQLRTLNEENKKPEIKSDETKDDKFTAIQIHVEANEKYLDPMFSLEILASQMNMSTSLLSQIINTKCGCNFSDYINTLRVEKAKKFLLSPEYNDYKIISIGLECGFNSKSTFYAAFKKFTNQTPSEFKLQNS